jgi:cell division transport system permease protein
MTRWFAQHWRALALATRKLSAAPWSALASIAAMGVAFSLPAGGYVLLEDVKSLAGQVESEPQLSVFLALDAGKSDVTQFEARLKQHADVRSVRFVPKDEALARLKQNAGISDLVESLGHNPLPDAFIVRPKTASAGTLERLRDEVSKWPKAEHVQLDSAWAKRLESLLRVGKTAVLVLAVLLAFALVTAIFNTIRLQVLTQRDEIEVAKLVGATDGFIRRPFLYYGALQGLTGAAAAWVIVALALWVLNAALADLARLYALALHLEHLSPRDSLSLLGFGAWLGWLGAWLSVDRHLWQIEPR